MLQERLQDVFTSPQTLGLVVSLAYAFGAVAQLTMGRLLHRFSLKWPFIVMTLFQAPLLLALAHAQGGNVIALVEPRQGLAGLYLILGAIAALTFVAALAFPRTPAEATLGQQA